MPVGTLQSPMALLNPRPSSSDCVGASIFYSALQTAVSVCAYPLGWALLNPLLHINSEHLYIIPDCLTPSPFGVARHGWAALLDMHYSIPVGTPRPGFAPLNFILHSTITISALLAHLVHTIRHSSHPCSATLCPPMYQVGSGVGDLDDLNTVSKQDKNGFKFVSKTSGQGKR
jgi:hypothetical protein